MAVLDKKAFARHISAVLNPLVALSVVTVLVGLEASELRFWAVIFSGIILFFSVLLPALIVFGFSKSQKIDGLFIPQRAQRIQPLLLSEISCWAGVWVLYVLGAPSVFVALMVCVAVLGGIALFITLQWKISLHAMGLWASWGVVTLLYGWGGWIAIIPASLVAWSRWVLETHSGAQVLAGSVLGAGVTFIVFGYFLGVGVSFVWLS